MSKRSEEWKVGKFIYDQALGDRKGFDMDLDDDIWDEIYEDIGEQAMKCFSEEAHLADV